MQWRFDAKLLKTVWSLAWPTVTFSVLQSAVGLVDVLMVGVLGKEAIAAVGFSQQFLMLIMVGALAITTGTTALVAQFVGARKREEAGETGRQALIAMFLLAMILSVPVVLLARPALWAMGARGEVLDHAVPYMQVIFGGMAFLALNFSTGAVFRGAGDMLTPLKIAVVINVLNIILNYLFIFGPGPFPRLGVVGAAVGTVSARGLGGLVAVLVLSRPGGRIRVRWANGFRLRWDLLRRMFRIGLPAAGAGLFRNGARVLFFWVVAKTASRAVAIPALTVAFRLRMVVIMPALAFQVAATALVGQAIGRGDKDQAERLGWEAIKLCGLVMVILSGVVFAAAEPISHLFHREAAVRAACVVVMRFVAFAQVFSALSIVSGGALAGAGDTRPALVYTIISQWLILLPLAVLLALVLKMDALGAWWAWAVAGVPHAALTLARFASGKWRRIRV